MGASVWLHGNTDWAIDWVAREDQGWIGMTISEDRTRTRASVATP